MTIIRPERPLMRTSLGLPDAPGVGAVRVDVAPPVAVDRLVVHQVDLARPSPGGIDTCLRGLLRYAPEGTTIAVVGVDTGSADVPGRRIGQWEEHTFGDRRAWFLPVAQLDPGDQRRRVPHSLRLVAGVLRHRRLLPDSAVLQAHRADTAFALRGALRRPLAYFIHTQEAGLTGATSDSMWRRAGSVHAAVERRLVRSADSVVVFNPDYAETVREHNARTLSSPTWFDPGLIRYRAQALDPHRIVWVGRLEEPKDPALAVATLEHLVDTTGDEPWTLDVVGSGTLLAEMERLVATKAPRVRARVRLLGRLRPEEVADAMSRSAVFLMTSHPGYEGFPRVLVEALASGLPAVVTDGSDTGSVVAAGRNGFVCGREPHDLAQAVRSAVRLDRGEVRSSADVFGAPQLVARIIDASTPVPG